MPTTAEQITALETALASGVLKVREAGREVEYAKPQDLVDAIAKLKANERTAPGFSLNRIKPGAAN